MTLLLRLVVLVALVTLLHPWAPAAALSRPTPPLAAPAPALELTPTNHTGGHLAGLAVRGDYAYGWVGPSLLVFAVADPAHPALIGRVLLPADIVDMALGSDYAYLALGADGSAIVRITDPRAPVVVGHLDGLAFYGIAAQGDHVYAATGTELRIYDAANSAAPRLLGAVTTAPRRFYRDSQLIVSGTYAYVPGYYSPPEGGPSSYLAIVHVADPAQPRIVGWVPTYFDQLAVAGRYLYLAASYCSRVCTNQTRLATFDIADPTAPVQTSEALWPTTGPLSMVITDGIGYLAGAPLDLRTPAAPALLPRPAGIDAIIAIDGQRGFARGPGVQILSLVTPARPVLLGQTSFLPASTLVSGHAHYLLSIDAARQVTIADLAAQPAPQIVSTVALPGTAAIRDLASAGAVSYVATADALLVVDWRTPAAPVISRIDGPHGVLQVTKDQLYASVGRAVLIYDISDPAVPQLMTSVGGFARELTSFVVRNDLMYAYQDNGRLVIYTIADPENPQLLSDTDASTGWACACRLRLGGGYLFFTSPMYVGSQLTGQMLNTIDIGDPRAPRRLVVPSPYLDPLATVVGADERFIYLYVGNRLGSSEERELEVWDGLARPAPVKIARFQLTTPATAGVVVDGRLMVTAGLGGVYVFTTPQVRVAGMITSGYGQPVAGVVLEAGGQTVTSGPDGTFALPAVPVATTPLTVTPRGNGLRFSPAYSIIGPGAEAPLAFVALPASASVTVGTQAAALVVLDTQQQATVLNLPAGAVAAGTTVTLSPTLLPAAGPELIAGHAFELTLSDGAAMTTPVTLTVGYSPSDLRRVSDPAALRLARWADGAWVDADAGCGSAPQRHEAVARWVRAAICQPGRYALLGPTNRVALPTLSR